jgi:radical SAM family uncharacterized protein
MSSVWKQVEPLLLNAQHPSQYIGGEVNSIVKAHSSVRLKLLLAFPDTYKIGMSHLGIQILYGIINKKPDMLAERVFTPWNDMEKVLKENNIPLYSLETHTPIKEFDIIGFSLQHELCYTNTLNMLHLGGIPLKSAERSIEDPLVIAGGPAVFNPEPMSDFIDIFVIGDGEEILPQLCDEFLMLKKIGMKNRYDMIRMIVKRVPALYAPCLYDVTYNLDGTVASIKPKHEDVPPTVKKSVLEDLDNAFYPTNPVIPFAEAVHDRINLEIMRGCPHSCRFCISNTIKSPVRYRSVETLVNLAEETYKSTGYDEISLLSLSSGDYPWLPELLTRLNARFRARKVSISLPSLHIDEQLRSLPAIMSSVRKEGITMAPEAGSARLRRIIDKPIEDEDLFEAIKSAYKSGWNLIKLYFMIGLPGEIEEDIKGLCEMINKASLMGKEAGGSAGNVNVTISPFTPKPHTAFQWVAMDSIETIQSKQQLIRNLVRSNKIKLKFHNGTRNVLEGAMSRGDRKLGKVILTAWESGCRFDSWDEAFNFALWQEAFNKNGLSMDDYARRPRKPDEILPWSVIESGTSHQKLLQEYEDAMGVTPTQM